MGPRVVDRSLSHENTVLLKFETGDIFRIPSGMTVREAASHLLTPDVDKEVEKLLKRIYEAGEKQIKEGKEPDLSLQVNGESSSMETVLESDSKIEVQEKN